MIKQSDLSMIDQVLQVSVLEQLKLVTTPDVILKVERHLSNLVIFDLMFLWSIAKTQYEKNKAFALLIDECRFLDN